MGDRMKKLEYRSALVTGASSGIGAALARRLADDGIEVVLAARRGDIIDALAHSIRHRGGRARSLPLDVAQPEETAGAIRALDAELGGLDLIVANAGVGGVRWSGALEWEDCAPMIDVNVRGAIATLTAVLPKMVERGRGHVVGVSSMAAYRGLPHNACYSASKAFLSIFLESLRVDLSGSGVAVTDVRPGFVRSPMTDRVTDPKPFMMETTEAAEHIVRGLARRTAVVAFPWPMAALVRSMAALPAPIFDRAARTVRPPTRQRR